MHDRFPQYTAFDPTVPVWCITPDIDGCIHRFFDASSISPSGRYVSLFRFRAEDRLPHPAWDRAYKRIAFNGCDNGIRRVYLADLSELL